MGAGYVHLNEQGSEAFVTFLQELDVALLSRRRRLGFDVGRFDFARQASRGSDAGPAPVP